MVVILCYCMLIIIIACKLSLSPKFFVCFKTCFHYYYIIFNYLLLLKSNILNTITNTPSHTHISNTHFINRIIKNTLIMLNFKYKYEHFKMAVFSFYLSCIIYIHKAISKMDPLKFKIINCTILTSTQPYIVPTANTYFQNNNRKRSHTVLIYLKYNLVKYDTLFIFVTPNAIRYTCNFVVIWVTNACRFNRRHKRLLKNLKQRYVTMHNYFILR